MSKQSFPAELRIVQSVDTLSSGDNSLKGVNTNILSDRAIVIVEENNSLYMLRKESTAAESSPAIIAPAAGPGRWYRYSTGPSLVAAVNIFHADIPPQSSVDSAFTFTGLLSTDIVEYNLTDSGLPAGVVNGDIRVTGADSGTMRFLNATGATVAAATVTYKLAAFPGT